MKIHLAVLKRWCDAEISPVAWQRIAVHLYKDLKAHGWDLKRLQMPSATDEFEGEEVTLVGRALQELYQKDIPADIL